MAKAGSSGSTSGQLKRCEGEGDRGGVSVDDDDVAITDAARERSGGSGSSRRSVRHGTEDDVEPRQREGHQPGGLQWVWRAWGDQQMAPQGCTAAPAHPTCRETEEEDGREDDT